MWKLYWLFLYDLLSLRESRSFLGKFVSCLYFLTSLGIGESCGGMTLCRQILLCALLGQGMLLSSANAQTFVVGDRTTSVNNANIRPGGLQAGDTISFQGGIGSFPTGGSVEIDPVLSGLTLIVETGVDLFPAGGFFAIGLGSEFNGSLTNKGKIAGRVSFGRDLTGSFLNLGSTSQAVALSGSLRGLLINLGTIQDVGPGGAVNISRDLQRTGVIFNSGLIRSAHNGIQIVRNSDGRIDNFGSIVGESGSGILILRDLTGSIVNSGILEARGRFFSSGSGIEVRGEAAGDVLNQGRIIGFSEGVRFGSNFNGSFENAGTIVGTHGNGIEIGIDFHGGLLNQGIVEGAGADGDGLRIRSELNGSIVNQGLIKGEEDAVDAGDFGRSARFVNHGILVGGEDAYSTRFTPDGFGSLNGRFENFGVMRGGIHGFDVDGTFSGEIFNCGIIEAGADGFSIATGTGTIHNHGGRIQAAGNAISLGAGNGRVVLSGPSHIIGAIDGGGGTGDVLRFQNIRGVSAEKEAELIALAASDPNAGTVTLFGESIHWLNIEDIQIDASTLDSYESLLAGAGLGSYGASLDQISGLDDDLRDFLKGLNDFSRSELNRAAGNASGQTLKNSMGDLRRERDTNFFGLLSNQFSSLRGEVSGSDSSVRSNGFLSQEVEIGATIHPVDPKVDTWISSYVGSGTQEENGLRSSADYDQASILFGRGRDLNEYAWLGVFGGYSRGEGQVDSFGSYLNTDGAWLGLNALLRNGDAFAALSAGFGFQEVDTARRDFRGNLHEGATEAFGGFLYGQVGRDLFFGDEGHGKLTPYVGYTYGADSTSAFSESGPVSSRLRFQDDSDSVVQTMLGLSVSGQSDTRKGWIRPRADLAWWRSYGGDTFEAGIANSSVLGDFIVASPAANENRFVIQAGVEMGLNHLEGWTLEAGYLGVFGEDDYSSHGGTFGARVEF